MPRFRPVPAALLLTVALGALGAGLTASAAPAPAAAGIVTAHPQDEALSTPAGLPTDGTDDMYWD
jgi:hypothetical protein